ncbi:uncharacterized protein G2W53_014546 [Senna tora]|uniref:Uncharacterized protein n=1 Tax=Senna tora TaxID=362788 RepID=A0A834WTT2_9FABA|nr:uncharacterized protein G2W53_014546 [Senna tora]
MPGDVLVLTYNVILHAAEQQDSSYRVLSLPHVIRLYVPPHLLSRAFPIRLNSFVEISKY